MIWLIRKTDQSSTYMQIKVFDEDEGTVYVTISNISTPEMTCTETRLRTYSIETMAQAQSK